MLKLVDRLRKISFGWRLGWYTRELGCRSHFGPEAFGRVNASTILGFEGQQANISVAQAALRDPWATYYKFNLTDIVSKYLLVASYFRGVQANLVNQTHHQVLVPTPTFFDAQDALLRQTDLTTLKAYLSFHLVHARSTLLGESFRQANHDFSGVLQGVAAMQPRD
ncbi:Aste57867_1574 [Aphanomyces stellatus]|uniref:Aste57867_1574 protein n=1 Tax=Aphanomyces stellatus TaxID=120398 RepID=A0A485K601_9STRA|nr:hypothetical protein As57867_001573 [Aphanomyces stellatus]VFT78787.1 Aste57867_1574 [Aphanomyces stellatus]